MGTLLQFSPKAPHLVTPEQRSGNKSADVLLFTGVRYERTENPSKNAVVQKPTRRRKG